MKKDEKDAAKSSKETRDLQDSPRDEARLQPEETTIDLPDVKDILGQEFIHPPSLGELADTTISSDDEEGVGLFDENGENNTPNNDNTYSLDKEKRGKDKDDTLGNP